MGNGKYRGLRDGSALVRPLTIQSPQAKHFTQNSMKFSHLHMNENTLMRPQCSYHVATKFEANAPSSLYDCSFS